MPSCFVNTRKTLKNQDADMKNTDKEKIYRAVALKFILLSIVCVMLQGCNSTKIYIEEKELAKIRMTEPILVIQPLTPNPRLNTVAASLGKYYSIEVPKRMKGTVLYSSNITSLKNAQTWNNLIRNGTVNTMEAAAIGKTVGSESVLTCQILELNQFPPFRITLELLWIDTSTGNIIGRLYQDIDLADADTNYRFSNFAGQGPARELYETFAYSKDLYQTAYLMPQEFYRFSAAYSTKVLFGDVSDTPWWIFWRSM